MPTSVSVRVTREIPASPDRVWLALSDPATLRAAVAGTDALSLAGDATAGSDGDATSGSDGDPALDGGNPLPSLLNADDRTRTERTVEAGASFTGALAATVGGHDRAVDAELSVERARYPTIVATGEGTAGDHTFRLRTAAGVEPDADAGSASSPAEPSIDADEGAADGDTADASGTDGETTEVLVASEAALDGPLADAGPTVLQPLVAAVVGELLDEVGDLLARADADVEPESGSESES